MRCRMLSLRGSYAVIMQAQIQTVLVTFAVLVLLCQGQDGTRCSNNQIRLVSGVREMFLSVRFYICARQPPISTQ